MFSSTAETSWNNMAVTPVFPLLMQKMVTYLAGREFEESRIVGDSISLSYTEQPDATDGVFETPSGKTVSVPVKEYRKQFIAMLEDAKEAGFYKVKVSVQGKAMPIAVNVDTAESEIATLSESELRKNLEGLDITVAASDDAILSAIASNRTSKSSWRIFIIIGIILLLLESFLAEKFLKKRRPDLFSKQKPEKPNAVLRTSTVEVSQDA